MDRIMSLVLLLACARTHCEPLREALLKRNDAYGVYANDFSRGYEPTAYAAVPLHAPLPIFHIVSTAPLPMTRYPPPPQRSRLPSPNNLSPSYSHHVTSYVQAPSSLATSYTHQTHYRPNTYPQAGPVGRQPATYDHHPPVTYGQQSVMYVQQPNTYPQQPVYRPPPNVYAPPISYPMNEEPPENEDDSPTILYARPQPQGGYTYHRKPSKKRVPPKKKEPFTIKIHKYRVVKGR